MLGFSYRVYGTGQASPGFGHTSGSVPQQKMGIQLVRVCAGADYVQIFRTLRGPEEVSYR